jgi:hypothetical protein
MRFLVESKSFVFLVLDGASVLRVEEKRKGFFNEVLLSNQCTIWLALTMEILLGFPGDKEFVKSFRDGTKVLIVRRSGNKDGRFLEAATAYGMGGQRGILLILEGRGWWGRHKFADELRKAKDLFFAMVGCGSGSLLSTKKKGGKEEGPSPRSSPIGVSSPVVKKDGKEILGLKVFSPSLGGAWPIVGGALPLVVRSEGPVKLRFPLVERSDIDFLLAVRPAAPEEVRMIPLDCSVLEKEPLGKDLLLKL